MAPRTLIRLNVRLKNYKALTHIEDSATSNSGREIGVDGRVGFPDVELW
jgi:hypothetical protein